MAGFSLPVYQCDECLVDISDVDEAEPFEVALTFTYDSRSGETIVNGQIDP